MTAWRYADKTQSAIISTLATAAGHVDSIKVIKVRMHVYALVRRGQTMILLRSSVQSRPDLVLKPFNEKEHNALLELAKSPRYIFDVDAFLLAAVFSTR